MFASFDQNCHKLSDIVAQVISVGSFLSWTAAQLFLHWNPDVRRRWRVHYKVDNIILSSPVHTSRQEQDNWSLIEHLIACWELRLLPGHAATANRPPPVILLSQRKYRLPTSTLSPTSNIRQVDLTTQTDEWSVVRIVNDLHNLSLSWRDGGVNI